MKKQLLILVLLFMGTFAYAQVPILNLSIADANMLPNMKPSGAHYKVDRVYGQNLQTEYYFVYGTPTSPLSPFLASLHLNITSTWVDPSTGIPVVGYWTSEKVYGALVNTIDFSKSLTHLVSAADLFKSDSLRIAADSTNLETYKGTVTSALAGKFNNPTGTATQYINGQGNSVSFQWLTDSTLVVVTQRFVSKDSVYNNPTWIGYLDYSTKLQNKPNLSVYETTSHASATYYPLTNPSGYISSYTETDPLFDSKLSAKTTTDLAEGTNLYFTTTRARSSISAGNELSYNSSTGAISKTKRTETYSGTTNGSGLYTVTFGTAYSVAPNIQANIINGAVTNSCRVTSVSTTGFTITANNMVSIAGLVPTFPVLSGANIDVLVSEK